MQKILFLFTISFSSLVLHGMDDTRSEYYTLDNMPQDILQEILDTNGKISTNDLRTHTFYKDCVRLDKTTPFKDKRNKDKKNRVILNEKAIDICNIGTAQFNTIAALFLVNKKLNATMLSFKPTSSLTDENILLKPNYFKNFFVYLMNLEGHFKIDGLESNNYTFLIDAHIDFKHRACRETGTQYQYPAIYMHGSLFCPIKEHLSDYTESTNTPIVSAMKQLAHGSSNFDNVHHLFNVISQEAFGNDRFAQEKLAKCLALCAYLYNHFNDFSYAEPRQTPDFKNIWGFDMAEFNLNFDMGSMDQASIPLALIYNILEINIDKHSSNE